MNEQNKNLGKIQVESKNVKDLNPAEYNPRRMSEKAREGLSNSINTFGLVQPIIWNKQTGNVVGGHQRLYDLIQKGVEETDVIVVDLPLSKEKALNIALNHHGISGEWDDDKLSDLLEEMLVDGDDIFHDLNFDELSILDDELPEVDLEGGEDDKKKEVLIISFEDPESYHHVCETLGLGEGARSVPFAMVREKWGIV